MINFVVTSKPVDGLFYYSYEYCNLLNKNGIPAQVVVICHRDYTPADYTNSIEQKYIHCSNLVFDNVSANADDVQIVMGRSMVTLSWLNYKDYTPIQQQSLNSLFSGNLISVYSTNHVIDYPKAINFYKPNQIINLCDQEVYPEGEGIHFEKTIDFSIYKPYGDNIQFKHLFLGTNERYYRDVEKHISNYPDHGILTYDAKYVNIKHNNVFVPVTNLMSIFETYVYTKETFDPAPRIFQECKYYGKDVIYLRDKNIIDGGSVYWKRPISPPDITSIVDSIENFK